MVRPSASHPRVRRGELWNRDGIFMVETLALCPAAYLHTTVGAQSSVSLALASASISLSHRFDSSRKGLFCLSQRDWAYI
jgi:hypothetical protein